MHVDYAQAEARPSPNFWAGFDQRDFIVVHATASGDNATEYVPDFNAATGKSTHYAIAMDGHVVQYVEEKNSAWGNCCVDGNSSFLGVPGYNWNKSTVSIENEKHSTDNSKPLTAAQYQSLLKLVRDIAARWHIPLQHGKLGTRGIIFHHDLMPIDKANCPGTFPYDSFFQDLQGEVLVKLNARGEVADYIDVSQFEPGESEAECGGWSIAENKFAGEPGKGPTGTPEQLDQYVDNTLGQINTGGVSIDDMHNLFHLAGVHYWDIASINDTSDQKHDQAQIKAALAHGYPVIVTIPEGPVVDLDLKSSPYSSNWNPIYNHIFTITGIASDGNPLVHDEAAVQGGIFGKLAPQPRHYSFDSLHIHWASIVHLPWLPPIPSGDPLSWPAVVVPQPPSTGRSTWVSTGQQIQAEDTWNLGVAFVSKVWGVDLAANTGIFHAWQQEYMNGRNRGFPITEEEPQVNWDNKPIVVQYFSSGTRCEWDGAPHWY